MTHTRSEANSLHTPRYRYALIVGALFALLVVAAVLEALEAGTAAILLAVASAAQGDSATSESERTEEFAELWSVLPPPRAADASTA